MSTRDLAGRTILVTGATDGLGKGIVEALARRGAYFDGIREARADAQAYDSEARAKLRALSDKLTAG
jgi:NAD(P)-dependent dehydrogenase (short-subunit alcohol dehydrogenase family)